MSKKETVEQTVEKFLRFNEKEILFRKIDGQYWVALKPICQALNVSFKRQHENLQNPEHFLHGLSTDQGMVGSDGSERKMTSLPEFYFYGWLFEVNGKSAEYKQYKWKCYEVLYDYFNGTITKRSTVLEEQHSERNEAIELRKGLREHPNYLRLKEIEGNTTVLNRKLKQLDADLLAGQTEMNL